MNSEKITKSDWVLYGLLFIYTLLIIPNNIGSGARDITLVLTFFVFLWARDVKWSRYWKDPILLSWLIFCGWLIITGLFNSPLETWGYTLRKWPMRGWLTILIFVELSYSEKKRDRHVLYFLVVTAFVWGLLGGYFSYLYEMRWQTGDKLEAFDVHWNGTARYFNLFIPFIFVRYLNSKKLTISLFHSFLLLSGIVGVFLSQSRAGTGSLIIGLTLLVFLLDVCDFQRKKVWIMIGVCLMTIGVLFSVSVFDGFVGRLQKKAYVKSSGRFNTIWPKSIEMIQDHPYFGNPMMSFNQQIKSFGGYPVGDAHNTYIQVLYNGGIVGLILYFLFLYNLLRISLRYAFLRIKKNYYLVAFLASFLILLIHGFVAHISYYHVSFLIALCYVARNLPDEYFSTQKNIPVS